MIGGCRSTKRREQDEQAEEAPSISQRESMTFEQSKKVDFREFLKFFTSISVTSDLSTKTNFYTEDRKRFLFPET